MDSSNNNKTVPLDLYQLVTDTIIAHLENGVIPWQAPWKETGAPMNLISKRQYRGINLWLLNALPYEDNYFLTWDQIKEAGGSVKKGENGHVIVYWKPTEKKVEETTEGESKKNVPLLRYYKVFNVAQCRELPKELFPVKVKSNQEFDLKLECEAILNFMPDMPSVVLNGKAAAYYNIEQDEITLPKMKNFVSSEKYYSTLYHELVHATGAERRLNRKSVTDRVPFGSPSYALEELIAEMGAAYLCRYSGILPSEIDNAVAYIDNWLSVFKKDKRFLISAAGQSQRACDFILNRKDNEVKEEVTES